MKKTLIYTPILLSLFANISSMEKFIIRDHILAMPNEIKLYIFELLIKDIIENNNIFTPFRHVRDTIESASLTHHDFNALKFNLIKFSQKYIQKYFASEYINLSQDEKDIELKNIFKGIKNEESEVEAAKLIIAGANLDLLIDINTVSIEMSLLIIIARTGKFKKLIALLIKQGANINAQNGYGESALILAVIHCHTDIVKSFIKAKADVNIQNDYGYTALMWAARKGYSDIAKLLIGAKADTNKQAQYGSTALMIAVQSDHKDIVELLISSNANINAKDGYGNTPLMLAVKRGYYYIVKSLIRAGADVNIKNHKGNTALRLALIKDYKGIVKLLLDAGAKKGSSYSCNAS